MAVTSSSVFENSTQIVVGEDSLWVEFVSDVDETLQLRVVKTAQLTVGQVMLLAPVRFTAKLQHR